MQRLNTERLVLRPYAETDFNAFAKMHSDPVLKANTHAKPMNRLQVRDLFEGYTRAYGNDGFGMWNIRRRDNDGYVGECGLWYRTELEGYSLRYNIQKNHWNQGFSIESVRATLSNAFDDHGLERIHAIAMHHNSRSIRVLERMGFNQVADDFRGVPGFNQYELTSANWEKGYGLPPARGVS
jgi:ribosomal-protein-alanine N-acetyltransferase